MVFGISPLDELFIGFLILICLLNNHSIKITKPTVFDLFIFITIFASIIGLFWDIKALRLFPILFSYFIFQLNYDSFFQYKRLLAYGLLFAMLFQISLTGLSVDKTLFIASDWDWQSTRWAGTAYSAYVFGLIYLYISLSSKNHLDIPNYLHLIIIVLLFLVSISSESRMLLVTSFALVSLNIFKMFQYSTNRKSQTFKINIRYIFMILLCFAAIFYIFQWYFSYAATLPSLIGEDESIEDIDRLLFLLQTIEYVIENPISAIFPGGSYSHQYLLVSFIEYGDGLKVRPTGIPAFIVDFGLLACFLLLFWGVNMFKKIVFSKISLVNKLFLIFMLGYIPFSLLITNLMESYLFFGSLFFLELSSKNKFRLLN